MHRICSPSNNTISNLSCSKKDLNFALQNYKQLRETQKYSQLTHLLHMKVGTIKICHQCNKENISPWSPTLGDRSLFIAWGSGGYWGNHLIFRTTKGGVSRNWEPKRRDSWCFGRIQRGDHSNFLGKWRHGRGGDRESHQMLLGRITSVKLHSKRESAKFHLV